MTPTDLDVFKRTLRQAQDWANVLADLEIVSQVLRHPEAVPAEGSVHLRRAAWEGALVAYMRCFNSGTRTTKLGKFTSKFNEDQRRIHAAAEHWRNKHAAHFEHSGYTSGLVRLDPKVEGRLGVNFDLTIVAAPRDSDWLALADLADDLAHRVKTQELQRAVDKLADLWPNIEEDLEYDEPAPSDS